MINKMKSYWHAIKPIIETNSSISDTILIAGSARSGTTWVGEIVAKLLKARLIFEPFLLDDSKNFLLFSHKYLSNIKAKSLPNYSLYLSNDSLAEENILYQIEKILKGKIRSYWTDRFTSIGLYLKRVIKDIRANLMLKFLNHKWPDLKIIWLIRNPIETIKSQLYLNIKCGWEFDFEDKMLLQTQLIRDWLKPFVNTIKKAKTLDERLTHRWCIENFIPYNQNLTDLSNFLMIRYDYLLTSENEKKKLKSFLNISSYNTSEFENYFNICSKTYVPRKKLELEAILKDCNFSEKKIVNIIKIYELEYFLN